MYSYYLLLTGLGALMVVIVIVAIGLYVWGSLVEYHMFQMLGYDKAWMAWIPAVRDYALCDIVPCPQNTNEIVYDGKGTFRIPKTLFIWLWAIGIAINFIPNVGPYLDFLLNIFYMIPVYIFVYSTFEKKAPSEALGLAIVSSIIPLVGLIMFTIDVKKAREMNIDLFNNNPYVYSINNAPSKNGGYSNGGYGQNMNSGYNLNQNMNGYNPQQNYSDPNVYGSAPQQNYGGPQTSGQPQQNYGGPQTYGQQNQPFGSQPQQGYGEPQTYGQQNQPFGSQPQQGYGEPQTYGAPQQDYSQPFTDQPQTYGTDPSANQASQQNSAVSAGFEQNNTNNQNPFQGQ